MGKHTVPASIRAALTEALRLDGEQVDQAIAWARQAGYTMDEVAGVVFQAAHAHTGRRGPRANDALRAAIFRDSPTQRHQAEGAFFGALRTANASGLDAARLACRHRAKTATEIAREGEQWLRAHGRQPGQQGFSGAGWGLNAPQGV